jgi:lysophospholipase L1-like esterase
MKKRLMFIGDSLIEFYDWEARFPQHEVLNMGISGERVEELLERLPRVIARVKEIDFLFIMTGINNIAMEDFDILSSYRGIVSTFNRSYKTATIVVQSVLPVSLYWIDNRLIRAVNSSLKDICNTYNADYLDVYTLFTEQNDKANRLLLLDDGVHISDKGYEIWSGAVDKYLRDKITSSPQAGFCV